MRFLGREALPNLLAVLLAIVAALLASACPALGAEATADYQVALTRGPDGWQADYRFSKPAPVWIFARTSRSVRGKDWRSISFQVRTPGVHLVRIGRYDAIFRDDEKPLDALQIKIVPFSEPLVMDYTPALTFSDGGVAFYTDQFTLIAGRSLMQVALLDAQADLSGNSGEFVLNDPQHPQLMNGEALARGRSLPLTGRGTYIYSGNQTPVAAASFAAVIDTGLPRWINEDLGAFLPRLMNLYTLKLGALAAGRRSALIAWGGDAQDGYSQQGSVLPGQLLMNLSGKMLTSPNDKIRHSLHWFFGHEASHFWFGDTVNYTSSSESWITEGSADFLAITALAELDPAAEAQGNWQAAMDGCLTMVKPHQPLAGAATYGEPKAFYACGSLLALAASRAYGHKHPKADRYAFLAGLIAKRRAIGTIDTDAWLAEFARSADKRTADAVRTYILQGQDDPKAFWLKLLNSTGVAAEPAENGIRLGAVT